jgi:uroporphyrinogen decarboxylase
MNSRERVLAALNHQSVDQIPIDFGGHRSSGIMAIAYAKLKQALDIPSGDIYVYDIVQQLAIVEEPVLNALGVDTVEMGRGFLKNPSHWQNWVLPDDTPCKIPKYINVDKEKDSWILRSDSGIPLGIQKKGCYYFEQIHFPLMDRGIQDDDFSDLEAQLSLNMWSAAPHPAAHLSLHAQGLAELSKNAKQLRQSTDRAVLGLFGGNLFEVPQFLYRIDNFLMYLVLYPDAVHRLIENLFNIYMKNLEKWLGAVGAYIDIILFGDDLGGQNGPLISPQIYREFFKPYHQRMWRRVKELADVKIKLHSCGAIEPFLPDLIDAGLEAINPVQISATGMNPKLLKEKYGERICFWGGGCDTQDILPNRSTAELIQHVQEQVNILSQGSGFVFQQVHNIMANVPTENILAMFEGVNRND